MLEKCPPAPPDGETPRARHYLINPNFGGIGDTTAANFG